MALSQRGDIFIKGVNKMATKNTLRNTAARVANLAAVRKAAFNSGTSRNAVLAATRAALGPKPLLALYDAARLELVIGFMAAALARKGDNREPDAIMGDCRIKLTKYQGFGGKQKLRKGMAGRRTKAEEEAYASARVLISGIMKDAGVTVPGKSGSNSKGRKPNAGKTKAETKPTNDNKPRKFADKAALVQYLTLQGAAMLATINKNAALAPNEAKSAVQDFVAAIKKL
jgi:hypothetical protein